MAKKTWLDSSQTKTAAFTAAAIVAIIWAVAAIIPKPNQEPITIQTTVYINSDGLEAIASLPSIGISRAREIIRFRENTQTGKAFNSVDDICKVKGIGSKTAEKIQPFINFDEAEDFCRLK